LLCFFFLSCVLAVFFFFFLLDPAPTEIYTLSLHDALPICPDHRRCVGASAPVAPGRAVHHRRLGNGPVLPAALAVAGRRPHLARDRKSTRLNSSHVKISYAVFCLKKKKKKS